METDGCMLNLKGIGLGTGLIYTQRDVGVVTLIVPAAPNQYGDGAKHCQDETVFAIRSLGTVANTKKKIADFLACLAREG